MINEVEGRVGRQSQENGGTSPARPGTPTNSAPAGEGGRAAREKHPRAAGRWRLCRSASVRNHPNGPLTREITMLRIVGAGVTAFFISASSLAFAQAPSAGAPERSSTADWASLTDARIEITKDALQLTADQEKYWPAVEDAIRNRAKNRQARIANMAARLSQMSDKNPIEVLRDRNPVDFMNRRADALAQRSADLKKLADAWRPLYQTLTPDQKRRLTLLAIFAIREMRSAVDQRREQFEDEDEE